MLAEDELRDAVLLVFANEQDFHNAVTTDKLCLHSLRQRTWYTSSTHIPAYMVLHMLCDTGAQRIMPPRLWSNVADTQSEVI